MARTKAAAEAPQSGGSAVDLGATNFKLKIYLREPKLIRSMTLVADMSSSIETMTAYNSQHLIP
jgi:hypothetical protein